MEIHCVDFVKQRVLLYQESQSTLCVFEYFNLDRGRRTQTLLARRGRILRRKWNDDPFVQVLLFVFSREIKAL